MELVMGKTVLFLMLVPVGIVALALGWIGYGMLRAAHWMYRPK